MKKYERCIAAFLMIGAIIFSGASMAHADNRYNVPIPMDVHEAVMQYAGEIEKSYMRPQVYFNMSLQQRLVANEVSPVVESFSESGLEIKDVSVDFIVDHVSYMESGALVSATMITKIVTMAVDGAFVVVGNKQIDEFSSSWHESHALSMEVNGDDEYSIIDDRRIDDVDLSIQPMGETGESKLSSEWRTLPDSSDSLNFSSQRKFGDNSAGINYIDMINYAEIWTSGEYAGNDKQHFNPAYPFFGGNNNCTNFVSQVMHAGGLKPILRGFMIPRCHNSRRVHGSLPMTTIYF